MLKFGASTLKRGSMDYKKDNPTFDYEKKIYFSQTVKAGKRIYYLDVKKNKRDELFLSITESKKVYIGDVEEGQYNFEKHKIFLYQEDFSKFIEALSNAIRFIHEGGAEQASLPVSEETGEPAPANTDSDEQPAAPEADAAEEAKEGLSDEISTEIVDDIDLKIDF